ncbi:MAG TPA: cytochrome c peroxidase [Stellaceae bacterium]|nr:cytochrome c peroxidase [Stellaceae bacterium]
MIRFLLCLAVVLVLAPPAGAAPSGADPHRDAWKKLYVRPEDVPFPDDDGYTDAKATLGRMLFFDPILSGSGVQSCASCHNPGLSWGNGLARGIGASGKPLPYRVPTLLDVAWIPVLGWEGKFPDLEHVAFTPITSPTMMNRKEADLVAALSAIPGYRHAFAAAFPDGAITRPHIEAALATFERTIVAGEAPFDRWIDGDEKAISAAAKRGFDLFNGKAGCAQCHSGWNFTAGDFYDIGTGTGSDIGRGSLFPNSPKLRYAFKVPTLRDVARRAPYMHDGSEPTLEAVLALYDRGGVDRPSRSELIKPLNLTKADKADLVAFLRTLTGDSAPAAFPVLPR